MSPDELRALTRLLKAKQAGAFPGSPTETWFTGVSKPARPAATLGYPSGRAIAAYLGRGVVRQTCSDAADAIGTQCYVAQGLLAQNAMVRVIRDGIVVYPPANSSARLDSLERFDEAVNAVAEGRECCVTIAGCTDLRPGDVIEAFLLQGDETA